MKKDKIQERLKKLYSAEEVEALCSRLWPRLHAAREEFSALPQTRWSEKDAILITYGDSVKQEGEAPLKTLTHFVRNHLGDAVSLVHILPFFPFTSDDGFSISDYEAVRPDLGSWEDIKNLNESHDLMFDLVLNHCSASHKWFQQLLKDEAPGKDYFVTESPETDLSQVVRPRTHPLLTVFDTAGGARHVWTTFSADQVDVDFRNPDVLMAYLELLLLYVRRGTRMIRLDAIAYLWKQAGTDCIHLWQTHEVVKLMRDVLEWVAPGVILLTETNVPHTENVSYFGKGDEARMVYQFPLPPLLLHGLRSGSAERLTKWASELEAPPEGCTFFNFTASHDGVGVRPLEGLVPMAEVKALAEEIKSLGGKVNERSHADGSTTPYEINTSYFSAMRKQGDRDAMHYQRFLLSQTVPMCLQGIPAFYIHSFTATENDLKGLARTGQNRSINRKQWDLEELEELLSQEDSAATFVLRVLTRRLKLRAALPDFHPEVPQEVLDLHPSVFALRRKSILALHNFSDEAVVVPVNGAAILMSDPGCGLKGENVEMAPCSVMWVKGAGLG
ncbi:sugar phosphorylase [Kiritimatiellaeota bacterium B1221]|nr:sugar phosphorylase [Kiritimatiellaeota bacterium B1221]